MPIERLGGVARQPGVGVERDAVADVAAAASGSPTCDVEAGVGGAAQQAVELLDLAALALPAHPGALARVPLPPAMEEEEAVRPAVGGAGVQGLDPCPRRGEDGLVVRHHARRRVGEVAERGRSGCGDRGWRAPAPRGARPARRRRRRSRSSVGTTTSVRASGGMPPVKSRRGQPARRRQPRHQPLHDRDREIARGHQQEQRHDGKPRDGEPAARAYADAERRAAPGSGARSSRGRAPVACA